MFYRKHSAHPPLQFIPQRFNPLVLELTHWLLPLLMRLRLRRWLPAGIAQVEVINGERCLETYRQFQAGQIRVLIAMRHPEVDDPLSMLYLFSRIIPRLARQQGVQLQGPIHSHFVYDRGMTIWAGKWLGWLFSRGGGIPIHRGKAIDRVGIRAARELLLHGRFPLSVAPEGGTNGHSEVVSPLEPGLAQLAFWCAEDLVKAGRSEDVVILPIAIQYTYLRPPWQRLDLLLRRLEKDCGLGGQPLAVGKSPVPQILLYQRLLRLADHLLTQMEQFYQRVYGQTIPPPALASTESGTAPGQVLAPRLEILLDIALRVAEDYFGLRAEGSLIDRCRRLEEASWQRIYPTQLAERQQVSSLARGLADWTAEEATLRVRHMRLVESFVAVTGTYIQAKPTAERFAETLLIMFDLVARIKGEDIPRRPRLGWRRSRISVGEPIVLGDRVAVYRRDRPSAKQAVQDLTQELQAVLEGLIE